MIIEMRDVKLTEISFFSTVKVEENNNRLLGETRKSYGMKLCVLAIAIVAMAISGIDFDE